MEHTELFDQERSNKAYEEDVGISSFGLASQKSEGNSISYDDETQGYITRYNNIVWGLGFIITREIVEDDQYAVVGQRRAQGLAFSMRQTKEVVAANVYNRAFNSSYTGGDGKEMCATDHPNVAGGTWANELSTGADLSEASLEQACIDLMGFTNDRGLRINVQPQKLIIPRQLVFEAQRILGSEYRPDTANNDINAIYKLQKIPGGAFVNHYLDDANNWFIRTNCKGGTKCFQRRPMEFTVDNDFDTENAKYKATERYAFGWTDPRGIFGSEVA